MSSVTDNETSEPVPDVDSLREWWTDPVRLKVAQHPSTPPHVIAVLAFDAEDYGSKIIAHYAVQHPALPHSVAVQLAASEKSEVRIALAMNPALSLDLVEQLLEDEYPSVRGHAAANPVVPVNRLQELADSTDLSTRRGVAQNKSAPFDVLVKLINDCYHPNYAWNSLIWLSDEAFQSGLEENGLEDWVGLPRDWVLKTLMGEVKE